MISRGAFKVFLVAEPDCQSLRKDSENPGKYTNSLPCHEASASVRHIPHVMICNSDMKPKKLTSFRLGLRSFPNGKPNGMPEGKYTRLDISRWVRLCEQAIEDLNNEGVTLLMEHVKGRLNLFEFSPVS